MPQEEQCFDLVPVLAGTQLPVAEPRRNILRGVGVCVGRVTANPATERLLIRAIFAVYVVAHVALLRRIGALNLCGGDTAFGGIPLKLRWNMREVGGTQVRVHDAGFEAHRGH